MLDALEAPIQIGTQRIWASASIGIAVSRPGDGGPEELLRRADTAMYSAKENGRNAYMLYNVNNPAPKPGRLSRESQLREAIKNRELAAVLPAAVHAERRCVSRASRRWCAGRTPTSA